ncbi:MAG: outer membrane protein transport protein [Leptospiraceae bacterium]|nr:outer membrane protein transport protein [Leptospiraceae bacterium]MCP5513391.1 outer membrane protein transport protein [Leptospiraceae bacterium]
MNKFKIIISIFIILFFTNHAFAVNGILLPSFGVRYSAMGGASSALHGSAMDIATNPANMARNKQNAIVEGGASYLMPRLEYKDYYVSPTSPDSTYVNNVSNTQNKLNGYIMPHLAYTSKVNENFAWGIGMYAYGGGGSRFDGIVRPVPGFSGGNIMGGVGQNPNPTINQMMAAQGIGQFPYIGNSKYLRENTFSEIQIGKITPGIAYKFGKLSLGLGLDVGVGTLQWRWTFSDPMGAMELPGAGYRYRGNTAVAYSGHVGLTYELSEHVAIAYTYQALSKFNFNGKTSIDAGDPTKYWALDTSAYMKLPESHRGGIAYSKDGLTLSLDLGYIKWSGAMSSMSFVTSQVWVNLPPMDASIAANPKGNDTNVLKFDLKWNDQRVIALGFEYKPNTLAYRLGYNYAKSPITGAGMNPMFPGLTNQHFTGGLGISFDRLDFDMAVEYATSQWIRSSDMSNWEMFTAFSALNTAGNQMPYYQASMKMTLVTPMIAVRYNF